MTTEYTRVGSGTDLNGKNWVVGRRAARLVLAVDPTATVLEFSETEAARFAAVWAEARHGDTRRAEASHA